VADLLARPPRGPRVCSCKVAADAALQIGMGAAKGGIWHKDFDAMLAASDNHTSSYLHFLSCRLPPLAMSV
jgi:hypothetical protein